MLTKRVDRAVVVVVVVSPSRSLVDRETARRRRVCIYIIYIRVRVRATLMNYLLRLRRLGRGARRRGTLQPRGGIFTPQPGGGADERYNDGCHGGRENPRAEQ